VTGQQFLTKQTLSKSIQMDFGGTCACRSTSMDGWDFRVAIIRKAFWMTTVPKEGTGKLEMAI
jgi:predicted Zn-dependent protease